MQLWTVFVNRAQKKDCKQGPGGQVVCAANSHPRTWTWQTESLPVQTAHLTKPGMPFAPRWPHRMATEGMGPASSCSSSDRHPHCSLRRLSERLMVAGMYVMEAPRSSAHRQSFWFRDVARAQQNWSALRAASTCRQVTLVGSSVEPDPGGWMAPVWKRSA